MKETHHSDSEGTAVSADTVTNDGITVTFDGLGIQVSGLGEDFGSTCLSVLGDLVPMRKKPAPKRNILEGITGRVCPGEMMLVLGRPGSGCTSLLKVLSNHREEFDQVFGNVSFDNMGPEEAKKLRHKIVMNTEGN
jgi:ATP-binding cassette, subfamily G (WHITE), member 2, SNQ2